MTVRNQVQTVKLSDLLPSQVSAIGGKVFTNAEASQADLLGLVRAWQSVHAVAFGQPIPSSGSSSSIQDNELTAVDLVAPGNNETVEVVSLSIRNDDVAPATVSVFCGLSLIAQLSALGPGEEVTLVGVGSPMQPAAGRLVVVKGCELTFNQSGATSGTIVANITTQLTIQG